MIFNNKICFIHAPKTAGMSLSNMLLSNLEKPVYYYVPQGHYVEKKEGVIFREGLRHETLFQAEDYLKKIGYSLVDFEIVFSILRNPYDLEVSRYHYLQLGHPWDKGIAQEFAVHGDFKTFAEKAPLYGFLPGKFEQYYLLNGKFLPNMKILRFEALDLQIKLHLGQFFPNYSPLPRVNKTNRKDYHDYIDPVIERFIYQKYKFIFDYGFYPREWFPNK